MIHIAPNHQPIVSLKQHLSNFNLSGYASKNSKIKRYYPYEINKVDLEVINNKGI